MAEWTEELLIEQMKKFNESQYCWHSLSGRVLEDLKRAAVLVPLFIRDGQIHILLTRRSSKMRHDHGDVAFPGGMADAKDQSESDTALRETWEEVGIPRKQIRVAAQLQPSINRRMNLITPVVGVIDRNFSTLPNEDEVEDVFILPLSRFLSQEGHTTFTFTNRGLTGYVHNFEDVIDGKKFRTWGLTAGICVEVAVAALQQEPEFLFNPGQQIPIKDPFIFQKKYLQIFESQYMSKI